MNLLNLVTGAEEMELGEAGAQEGAEAVAAAVTAEVQELATVIEEQGNQIEQLVDQVQELDETAEEVLENVEGMESMLQSGNFSSVGFANIFNRTDRLAAKLGYTGGGSRLGAESISDSTTAQMQSRTGLEGFMETVKAWGKKAIEYIKHIFNTVISFVVGLFSSAAGIEKSADNLLKRLSGAKVKEKISLGSWNAYFDYKANGLLGTVAGSSAGLEKFGEGVAKLVEQIKSAETLNVSAYAGAYKTLATDLAAAAIAPKGSKKATKKEAGKDVVIGQAAAIRIVATWKDGDIADEKACAEAARALKLVFAKDAAAAKKLSSGETKATMGADDLKKTLEAIKEGALELRNSKVNTKFSASERDRVVGLLNAVKANDEKQKDTVNKTVEVVKATYAALIAMYSSMTRGVTAGLRAALNGVSAHL